MGMTVMRLGRGARPPTRSSATTSAGTMNRSARRSARRERGLVPGPAPGRIGLGHPAPEQVVDRGHQGGPARLEGGQGDGVDHVEAAGRPEQAAVPAPGQHRAGQRVRRAAGGRGRPGGPRPPPGARLAASSSSGALVRRELVEALDQPADVGTDPARGRPAQLLGHHEQTHAAHAGTTGSGPPASAPCPIRPGGGPGRRPGRGRPAPRRTRSQVNGGAALPTPVDQRRRPRRRRRGPGQGAGQAVAVPGVDQQGAVARPPRGWPRPRWPPPGPRPPWPGAAGSRTPRRPTGRPGRRHRASAAAEAAGRPGSRAGRSGPGRRRPRRRRRSGSTPQPSPPTMTRATSGWAAASASKAGTSSGIVLAGLDGPDGQDVAAAARRAADGGGRVRPASGGAGWDPVVDGPDPLGIDAELGHHLVGHELRRGVDPGALGHRPADEVGEGQGRRVAQLGISTTVRSWTVTTRAARRVGGTTKLVPWTTSWRPMNHSTGGQRPRAQAGGGAGPAWPAAGGDPGGTRAASRGAAASSPRRRTRRRRAGRPGRPGPGTEGPDPGRPTQQRGGVEGHGQPVRVGRWRMAPAARREPCTSPVSRPRRGR